MISMNLYQLQKEELMRGIVCCYLRIYILPVLTGRSVRSSSISPVAREPPSEELVFAHFLKGTFYLLG